MVFCRGFRGLFCSLSLRLFRCRSGFGGFGGVIPDFGLFRFSGQSEGGGIAGGECNLAFPAGGVGQFIGGEVHGRVIAFGGGKADCFSVNLHIQGCSGSRVELQGHGRVGAASQRDNQLFPENHGIAQGFSDVHFRVADSLELVRDLRRVLVDDFGINISPSVVNLDQAILILFPGGRSGSFFYYIGRFLCGRLLNRLFLSGLRRRLFLSGFSFGLLRGLFLNRFGFRLGSGLFPNGFGFRLRSRLFPNRFGFGLRFRLRSRFRRGLGSGLLNRLRSGSFLNGSFCCGGCFFRGRFDCFICKSHRNAGNQQRDDAQNGECFLELLHHDRYPSFRRPGDSFPGFCISHFFSLSLHLSYIREDFGVWNYLKMGIRIQRNLIIKFNGLQAFRGILIQSKLRRRFSHVLAYFSRLLRAFCIITILFL